MADENKTDHYKALETVIGAVLAIAAILGMVTTIVAAGPNNPKGPEPIVLLPYAVVIVGTAAFLLLRPNRP